MSYDGTLHFRRSVIFIVAAALWWIQISVSPADDCPITIAAFDHYREFVKALGPAGEEGQYYLRYVDFSGRNWIVAEIAGPRRELNSFPVPEKLLPPRGLLAIHVRTGRSAFAAVSDDAADDWCIDPYHILSLNSSRWLIALARRSKYPNVDRPDCWQWELDSNSFSKLGLGDSAAASILAAAAPSEFKVLWPEQRPVNGVQQIRLENRKTNAQLSLTVRTKPLKCSEDSMVYQPDRFWPGPDHTFLRLQQGCRDFCLQTVPFQADGSQGWKLTQLDFLSYLKGDQLWCIPPSQIQRGCDDIPFLVSDDTDSMFVRINAMTGQISKSTLSLRVASFDASSDGRIVGVRLTDSTKYRCHWLDDNRHHVHDLRGDRSPVALCNDGSLIVRSSRSVKRLPATADNSETILFALDEEE